LGKRVAEIREQHKDELYLALSERKALVAESRTHCGRWLSFVRGISYWKAS
jgi:hypothetical protein